MEAFAMESNDQDCESADIATLINNSDMMLETSLDQQDNVKERNVFDIEMSSIPKALQYEDALGQLGVEAYHIDELEEGIIKQVDEAIEEQLQTKSILHKALCTPSKTASNGNTIRGPIDNKGSADVSKEPSPPPSTRAETEMERKIRMGEMTPFGNMLGTTTDNSTPGIEKYLEMQCELQKLAKKKSPVKPRGTFSDTLAAPTPKKRKSPLKREIFKRKKRRKTDKLGCEISSEYADQFESPGKLQSEATAMGNSSDSEYLPESSEDEVEEMRTPPTPRLKPVKRQRTAVDADADWHTDDEDWVDSDEENVRRRNKGGKARDDGVLDDYLSRVSAWEKENKREELEATCRELDNGFKIPSVIWNKLYKYQKVGVQWMWELHQQRCGGILGDEMGLGKTVQIIAFLTGVAVSRLRSKHGNFRGLGPVLIVCPTTIMHQWVAELHKWWGPLRAALLHLSGAHHGSKKSLIHEIVRSNGILITSYKGCVQHMETISRYRWHYLILDEGHKIRNPESQVAIAVKLVDTPHRLILSGSPMQNNLKELWSLFDFIFPGKLGTLQVFMAEFAVPITQGGYANASQVQVATAYKCATVLRDTISPYLLRRMKSDVKSHINLPSKNEQVLFCKLTDDQRTLYRQYLNSGEVGGILDGRYKVFVGLINLRKICNHPDLYSGGPKLFKWDEPDALPPDERFGYWERAGKMVVVKTLLELWKKQNHRVLIFTQSKQMLTILVAFVQTLGYEYLKLDGDTNIAARQPLIKKFNEDSKYFVFLATTQVGGLGVNLTGADRVVIYDPDWNPATDAQARERAWRIGQLNQVTIYRLVTAGTIEEKIYHRQIFKQFLTNKVLKDPRQRRFFKSNDLYELFTLKETDDNVTETSALFAGTGSEITSSQVTHRDKVRKIKSKMSMDTVAVQKASLSQNKIEAMKKMAAELSKKISSGAIPSANSSETVKMKKKKKKDRAKSRKRLFEGQEVPNLVKHEMLKNDNSNGIDYAKQDEYILKKLFSKSGIQTALKHDKIMEEGPSDYALVEAEAGKVARDAVKALKESRAAYQAQQRLQPKSKPRFKGPKRAPAAANSDADSPMSVEELMIRIKERNGLVSSAAAAPAAPLEEHCELLGDIRNFVSYGASQHNQAGTEELLEKFRERLPAGKSPVFKALLNEVCDFFRTSDGVGMWSLRSEFRW